jgi:hypothetical protein
VRRWTGDEPNSSKNKRRSPQIDRRTSEDDRRTCEDGPEMNEDYRKKHKIDRQLSDERAKMDRRGKKISEE